MEPGQEKWLGINAEFAKVWPNITIKKGPLPDAKQWESVANKYEEHFSATPGTSE
jgi:ferredoxin